MLPMRVGVVQGLFLFLQVYLERTNASSQTNSSEHSSAVTYFVSPFGSDAAPGDGSREHPFRTLGFALTKAGSTQAITLMLLPGHFSSTSDSYLELGGHKSLTFQGQSAAECIVDLGSSGAPFLFDTGVRGSHVHFADMTIANARGGFAAVAVGPHGSSSFNRVVFRNNSASVGPGALIASNTAELTDCLFQGNHGGVSGALELGSRGLVHHCSFVANHAFYGGAASVLNGPVSFSSCNFVNNTAFAEAGAVFVNAPNKPSTTTLLNCTFWNNAAFNGGAIGALYPLQLVGCHFFNNVAVNSGGAVVLKSTEPVLQASFSECTFSGNFATFAGALSLSSATWLRSCSFSNNVVSSIQASGGGALWTQAPTQMYNCSFVGNEGYALSDDYIVRGGAVFVSGQTGARANFTTITRCTFDSNTASAGGAVHLDAPVVIQASTFTENFASSGQYGGGGVTITNFGGNSPVITNCVFERNLASAGGAVSVSRPLRLQNSTFIGNSAFNKNAGGGAFYAFGTCGDEFWIIDQCLFRNNSAPGGGGAMFLESGKLRLQQCSFDHNSVPNPTTGGGAVLVSTPNVSLEDCTFTNNSAPGGGGAVAFTQRSTMFGCVFVGNIAVGGLNGGGAVLVVAGSCATCLSAANCTFQNNLATTGGAIQIASCATVTTARFVDNRALVPDSGAVAVGNMGTDLDGLGGAVVVSGGILGHALISHCHFAGNSAAAAGGAVSSRSGSTIRHSTFSNNAVTSSRVIQGGGALFIAGGQGLDATNVSNCTFSSNMAVTSAGGAILLLSASQLQGCNFANNTSSEGGAVATKSYAVFSGCVFTNNRRVRGTAGASIFVGGAGGAAALIRSALCDATAKHSITCNGTKEVTVGFSSVVPARMVASRPCRLVELVASELLLSPDEATSIFFGAMCGPRHLEPMYTSWSGVHVSFPTVLTVITFLVVTAPGASLAVTGPLPNTSTPAQLTDPAAFQYFSPTNSHGGIQVEVSNVVDGACSSAGCFPEFGLLIESPPDVEPSTATEFVVIVREHGLGVSLSKTTLDVVGLPFAWVGITARLLVELRDQVDRPISKAVTIVVDGNSLPCDSSTSSSVYVCSVTFNREGKYRVSLHSPVRGPIGDLDAAVLVVSIAWPIALLIVLVLTVSGLTAWTVYKAWRRYRQRVTDNLLADYVGLGSSVGADLSQYLDNGANKPFFIDKSMLIKVSDIDIRRQIAAGAAGTVSLGTWKGTSVAVKRLYKLPLGADEDTYDEHAAFVKELALHKSLRHPNVVQLLGVCPDPLLMVLEFMARGSLFACLRETGSLEMSWPLRARSALDVARGMMFLHAEGILHRDLKSLNVLVNEDWRCKVADFDQSRTDSDLLTGMVGTVLWSAPEVLEGSGNYGKEADVYSFGIVMFECWTKQAPFQGPKAPKPSAVHSHIIAGGRPVCPPQVDNPPPRFAAVMRQCWSSDPHLRPHFSAVADELERICESPDEMGTAGETQDERRGSAQSDGRSRSGTFSSKGSARLGSAIASVMRIGRRKSSSTRSSSDFSTPLLPIHSTRNGTADSCSGGTVGAVGSTPSSRG